MALGPTVGNWRCEMYAAIESQSNSSVTISCTAAIQTVNGYWYSGLNVHGDATVNGQTASADRTGVNVNAGGNVNIVTKKLSVAKGKGAKTINCSGSIRVTGYAAGTSSASMTVTVPALPSHRVSYNANGGTGAPAAQTKWYGEFLTLSGAKPTRPNYVFQGWSTSANGAVAYQPGGRYGSDANLTLYAVWKLATKPPTIPAFTAQRVDADGNLSESGTRVQLAVTYKCDTAGDSSNAVQSLKVAVQSGATWAEQTVSASGATGMASAVLDGLSADSAWRFRATVKDKYGSVTSYTTVGPQRFLLDFSADGKGIGIGVGAPAEGVAINGSPVTVNGCRMPRIYAGSKVITPAASSNRHTLFTAEEWASITGTDIADGYPTVLVANGDVTAQNVAVTGAGYEGSTKRWYVWLASSISTVFRVNYTIII